VNIRYCI